MRIGNYYIIHKNEFNKMNALERELKRTFTPAQWADIREGRSHVHKNPPKKDKAV